MDYIKTVAEYIGKIAELTKCSSKKINQRLVNQLEEVVNDGQPNLSTYNMSLKKDVNKAHRAMTSIHTKYNFYFRGHYNETYKLIPSVFRNNNWNKEDYYYHEMLVRCPNSFENATHLDKLVLMQHYDCPTRLLDITANPLVALYFACKNFNCPSCVNATYGEVFIFPVLASEISYFDSDKALMLSCLPKFTQKEKQQLYSKTLDRISSEKDFGRYLHIKGKATYTPPIIERFYHEVTTEMPSFQREIIPLDILRPLFVQPKKTNSRIVKQDGAFILSGLSEDADEALEKIKSLSFEHIGIKEEHKASILKELEVLGIHEASLFPELDKVARYLMEH